MTHDAHTSLPTPEDLASAKDDLILSLAAAGAAASAANLLRLQRHYEDQNRLIDLEAALADCVRYIATTYDSDLRVVSFAGTVAPKPEPECSIRAKRLLGWTLG